ncbi:MAG: PLP-dependent transferase [Chitinispirillaceae bacterium]|nr:PLP-dependent transferase [Chitinispirillaceae bacterium]
MEEWSITRRCFSNTTDKGNRRHYDALDKAIRPNTRFIFSESPTNPYLNIFDLVKLVKIAKKHKILTLIDSTFSTPVNQRPLEFGIDLVLQSCTKYLDGRNDIFTGAVLGRKELAGALHKSMGGGERIRS